METAESVFAASGRAKKAPGARLADGIADLVFSLIIYFFFMLQAAAAKNIPIEVTVKHCSSTLTQLQFTLGTQ